jgi:hypothetical protein
VAEVFWGNSRVRPVAEGSHGALVQRDGEAFYKIANYHTMAPFLMAIVSGSDHWMYVSSTGGLTCGRRSPGSSLFPYYTDDKIHDAWSTTGPYASLLIGKEGKTWLWKPFYPQVDVYGLERNLYKSQAGNRLIFEELNHQLGLSFSYSWSSSEQYGFVRKSSIVNTSAGDAQIDVLDGLRNLLPYGVMPSLQADMSTLVDAYKQAETIPAYPAAVYTLSSIPTDRAEPSEALKATVAWSLGFDDPKVLLSEDQLESFESGLPVCAETASHGKRGAFIVQASFGLTQGRNRSWYVLADVEKGSSQLADLLSLVEHGITAETVEADVRAGTRRLRQLVGKSDGCQMSSDDLVTSRHFSNTLFNIMRGGIFYDGYQLPADDFNDFVQTWNQPLFNRLGTLLPPKWKSLPRSSVLEAAENGDDPDWERIALEYLPLTFSRRHGDPSRPWNQFSIDIRNADGSDKLYYEGNWRDIFQNWEALARSWPEYIESFIAKFVNASTADGYNPYRLTRNGFEWEILDLDDPWSNIGYWGDHQINYLVKLLELSHCYHPGKIAGYLEKQIFVYADVPYRIKGYQSLLQDPRDSVEYDQVCADRIAERIEIMGSDGALVTAPGGSIYRVSLLEKLLVAALSKLGNFVPGGGIWMNTQRPEWNDANNALTGYGLSMVTLCYLRRFLALIANLLEESPAGRYSVSMEVAGYLAGIHGLLRKHARELGSPVTPADRKAIMDGLGAASETYRKTVYAGFSGEYSDVETAELVAFMEVAVACLDRSIAQNRRPDGLFHSYNLVNFGGDGYYVENLHEMLEGQVAVLSSGYLGAGESLELLNTLKSSRMYRSDQNSYMLYPYTKLPLFNEKNVIDPSVVQSSDWIRDQLRAGREDFIEQDVNGKVHFNGRFRNSKELRCALEQETGISQQQVSSLCAVFESLFSHRQFTGRSGAMYKYEGLGCIYWHMVSKLLLATGETVAAACQGSVERELIDSLLEHYDDILAGLGVHKNPSEYGAIPIDPYSHTTGFSGVQQPGMTGQVKEDIITRFAELGVQVENGEVSFVPALLRTSEFIQQPETWHFSLGAEECSMDLDAGSLAFSLCGVPVIYRLADICAIHVHSADKEPEVIHGNRLDSVWSASLFRRENRLVKLVVEIPETELRN